MTAVAILFARGIVANAEASADERVDKLTPAHRVWLEEEVVYIIADREREVFLSLNSVMERDRFIEAFWAKRDPNRATPTNEFRDEHYKRLAHANTYLRRDSFKDGWKTDRGRYYVILGEPRWIQSFEGYNQLVSCELWFYQGDPALGQPSFFYLLFFKRGDVGEYRVYDPVLDGPDALLRSNPYMPGVNNEPALAALREISPELAAASLSFDTSEPRDLLNGAPAIGTALMLARIEDSGKRVVPTEYADAYLRYGDRVTADYSFNFVPCRSTFSILASEDQTTSLHYSIEVDPENFTLEMDEDRLRYYTTLDLTLEVRNPDGKLLIADDDELYLELSPIQMEQVRDFPLSFQSHFPLAPGNHTVAVILRNRVSKQYTVAEAGVTVPDFSSDVFIPDVVLGYASRALNPGVPGDRVGAFQLGGTIVSPAAGNLFVIGDMVHILTQAYGAATGDTVRFDLMSGDDVLVANDTRVEGSSTILAFLKLDDIVGGDYEVRTRLQDARGHVMAERTTPIRVSPRSTAVRPVFVSRRGFNAESPALTHLVLSEQFWNLGSFDQARVELEKALASAPELPQARWKLAGAYLREGQSDKALELLLPLEQDFETQFEVIAGIGFGYYLEKAYEQAARYLSAALRLRAPDTTVLNALADAQQRLGNREAALEAFRQSLELDPNQQAVKNRMAALVRAAVP